MHGLEAVARIGQRALHDHAHRIVEVGTLQFIFDRDGRGRRTAVRRGLEIGIVAQNSACGSIERMHKKRR